MTTEQILLSGESLFSKKLEENDGFSAIIMAQQECWNVELATKAQELYEKYIDREEQYSNEGEPMGFMI